MAKRKKQKQHWTPLYRTTLKGKSREEKLRYAEAYTKYFNTPPEHVEYLQAFAIDELDKIECMECWKNDLYTVLVDRDNEEYGGYVHISFRRNDREPATDWRHKQNIKNQLVGEECEAVELFPAESRLVDTSNQYHLWCWPDSGQQFPVGWNTSRTVVEKSIEGLDAIQRETKVKL